MFQGSSLYPRLIDSNSIYCLLRQDKGWELLLRRIREDRKKGGIFGNKGNCCLIPETRQILLSDSAIRNSSDASDLVDSFKYYDYRQDRSIRKLVEKKQKEISRHSDYRLDFNRLSDREILYTTAVSLIKKGTIITNKIHNFNQVEKNLLNEDWTYEKEIICVRDNKPGLLYKVSKLIGENNVSIISATNQKDLKGNPKQNNFEFVIDSNIRNIPSDIKRRLANVKYENEGNYTKILFNHLHGTNERNQSNQILSIAGSDRKNLLADIAYFPFYKKYNILYSNSFVQRLHTLFCINFVFDVNLSKDEKLWLKNLKI